jgi:citrate lyase subunit beta/citryl-CoA lyase
MSMPPAAPLSYLFVPGNVPERFAKALASGADRVIVDLEDAVSPSDKAAAREAIAAWMSSASEEIRGKLLIRINDASTGWYVDDLQLLRHIRAVCVMLPKCESRRQLADVLAPLGAGATALPLVETARGLLAAFDLATAPGIARLAFGSLDYMADLDIPAHSPALQHAAIQLAIASRAAGLPSPVAGVTPDIDADRVAADMAQARCLGHHHRLAHLRRHVQRRAHAPRSGRTRTAPPSTWTSSARWPRCRGPRHHPAGGGRRDREELRAWSQIDWAKLKAKTEQIGYPIIAVVNQINAQLPDKLGEYCHWGATTQDITDTAAVLQMREGLALVDSRPERDLGLARWRRTTATRPSSAAATCSRPRPSPSATRWPASSPASTGTASACSSSSRGCWWASSAAPRARCRRSKKARWKPRPA